MRGLQIEARAGAVERADAAQDTAPSKSHAASSALTRWMTQPAARRPRPGMYARQAMPISSIRAATSK